MDALDYENIAQTFVQKCEMDSWINHIVYENYIKLEKKFKEELKKIKEDHDRDILNLKDRFERRLYTEIQNIEIKNERLMNDKK